MKKEIFTKCLQVVEDRILFLETTLKDLTASAGNETKSTAGDKHETALAMLQIEQENASRQLKDALQQKLTLEQIDITKQAVRVVAGSLLETNNGYLFLSVPLGKMKIGDLNFIALSPQSPLGSKLLRLAVNDSVEMNGVVYRIDRIF